MLWLEFPEGDELLPSHIGMKSVRKPYEPLSISWFMSCQDFLVNVACLACHVSNFCQLLPPWGKPAIIPKESWWVASVGGAMKKAGYPGLFCVYTPRKFKSSPLKIEYPKRKGLSSNHHFSGAMFNFGAFWGLHYPVMWGFLFLKPWNKDPVIFTNHYSMAIRPFWIFFSWLMSGANSHGSLHGVILPKCKVSSCLT